MQCLTKVAEFIGGKITIDNSGNAEILEQCWQQREEHFYKGMFGGVHARKTMLQDSDFTENFGRKNIHPFWLHHAVLEYVPNKDRHGRVFATSGMSNAWDGMKDEWSGLGVEFFLEEKAEDTNAETTLKNMMVYNLLLSIGHFADSASLKLWDIIPADEFLHESPYTAFLLAPPLTLASEIELTTGKFELLQIIGLNKEEAGEVKNQGPEAYYKRLL